MSVNPERAKLVGAMRDHQSFLVEKNQQIMDALYNQNKELFVAVLKNTANPDNKVDVYFRKFFIDEELDCNRRLREINPLFVTAKTEKELEGAVSAEELVKANLVRLHFVSINTTLPEDEIKKKMSFQQVNALFMKIQEQSDTTKESVEDLGKFR